MACVIVIRAVSELLLLRFVENSFSSRRRLFVWRHRPDTDRWLRRTFTIKDGFLLYYDETKVATSWFDSRPKVCGRRCVVFFGQRWNCALAVACGACAGCNPDGQLQSHKNHDAQSHILLACCLL